MSSEHDDTIPATMQAVTARGRGFESLAVSRVPVPHPGPDQLLARVDAAGVCTSILKLIAQGPDHHFINGWDMDRRPVILGDEGSVTVVKAGENLRPDYPPGRRFAVQPAVDVAPINHRRRYRDGAWGMRKCAVGYTLPGHLAQYILIQEEVIEAGCLLPLPDEDMPYFAVSMAEPISCVVSAQERSYHLKREDPLQPRVPSVGILAGGVAVVIGAGAMGRMHAELALRAPPAVLIVSDPAAARLRKTRAAIGAKAGGAGTTLVCVGPDGLPAAVAEASGGGGADDIILAVGIREVQQEALGLLGFGGTANLFGGLPKGRHTLQLDALDVHYREIRVVGSSGGDPGDMIATLRAIAGGAIDPGNYVAAVGSLDNAVTVLEMIRRGAMDGKAILYPHIRPTPLRAVNRWSKDAERALLAERGTTDGRP